MMFQMFHSTKQSKTAMTSCGVELMEKISLSLGRQELVETLHKLTGGHLLDKDIEALADHVFEVSDLNGGILQTGGKN